MCPAPQPTSTTGPDGPVATKSSAKSATACRSTADMYPVGNASSYTYANSL